MSFLSAVYVELVCYLSAYVTVPLTIVSFNVFIVRYILIV